MATTGTAFLASWSVAMALAGPVLAADWAAGGRILAVHDRVLTAGILAAAAVCQLTPLEHRIGCCVGLILALLALGMRSIGWMIAVGIAIAIEKTTRVGVVASRVTAVALALGAIAWAI